MKPEVAVDEVVQVVVHGALFPWLASVLEACGFDLVAPPELQGEDDLRTILVVPGEELAARMR